jgi:large subunit ribosomal protein L9
LFGSVTASDIAAALEKKGFDIDRRKIEIAHPIKTTGEFTVSLHLHKEVRAAIKVMVEKEAVAEESEPVSEA